MLRSEIESVKSGSGQADRVKQLETQISELEAEASRLLRALDQVKEAKAEGERSMKKKVDEATKEAAGHVSICVSDVLQADKEAAEIETLRAKVKQFGDYDEIKRELEIMKVSFQI